MSDAVFGTIVTGSDVEKAVVATLQKWSNTYIRLMERHTGRKANSLPNIASWRAADTMDERFPEQAIPAVQVMLTADTNLTTHAESASGLFVGTIDVLVQSTEPEPARELAELYAYAMGLIIVQHDGLDGSVPVSGIGWEKVGVPAVGRPESRWLALGSAEISIDVEKIFNPSKGPVAPDEEVPPGYPPVEHTDLRLET